MVQVVSSLIVSPFSTWLSVRFLQFLHIAGLDGTADKIARVLGTTRGFGNNNLVKIEPLVLNLTVGTDPFYSLNHE